MNLDWLCKSIYRAEVRLPEFISDRLPEMAFELCGRARAVKFVVWYTSPIDTRAVGENHAFWTALDRAMKEVPEHEHMFGLKDANASTGWRGGVRLGGKDCKDLDAYGRDTLIGNDVGLISFSANHGLALLNKFFRATKNATLHTFSGRDKKTHRLHRHKTARQKPCVGRYWALPTLIPTYLGSQHRHSTCKTAWSHRSQPNGKRVK